MNLLYKPKEGRPTVKIKKRWIPYFGNIRNIEKRLKELAKDGYELYDYNFFTFTFIESTPAEREYFVYFDTLEKNRSFYGEFSSIKRQYAKKKTRYPIEHKKYSLLEVIEINTDKIDDNYKWYFFSRNSYFQKWCITSIIAWCIFATLTTLLGILGQPAILLVSCLCWILFLNYVIALVLLKNEKRDLLKDLK